MTGEQLGTLMGSLFFPILGLIIGYYIVKDYKIKKQAKKEGLTYKEMKENLKHPKLEGEETQ